MDMDTDNSQPALLQVARRIDMACALLARTITRLSGDEREYFELLRRLLGEIADHARLLHQSSSAAALGRGAADSSAGGASSGAAGFPTISSACYRGNELHNIRVDDCDTPGLGLDRKDTP